MKRIQDEHIPFLYVIEYKPYRCVKWRIWGFGFEPEGTVFSSKEEAEKYARDWFASDHPDHREKAQVRIRKYKRGSVCGVVK